MGQVSSWGQVLEQVAETSGLQAAEAVQRPAADLKVWRLRG